jgi:cysteine dioxygenase type I
MRSSLLDTARPALSPAALRRTARGFAADRGLLDRCPVDDRERTWLRLPTGPDVAAWLLRWPAGTSTGWHDHVGPDGEGVRGVFTVLAGELSEAWWTGRSVVRRRLAPGALRSFGANHVHDVAAAGDAPAYSIHVYSPQLEAMRSYRIDDERGLVFTGIGPLDEW